jgi:hypothetical protein
MPVIIIVVPQFWHLRLSMIFSGLGINWGWGMAPPVSGGSVTGLSATDAWHRAEPVTGHIQHLSLESLVKMDHFQKEPPLHFKRDHWATRGVERGQYIKEQIGNPSQIECPLYPQKRTYTWQEPPVRQSDAAISCGLLACAARL